MKTIRLSAKEIRALKQQLWANACSSGCAFPEMQRSRKDCDECDFPKLIRNIEEKIGG